MAFELPNLPYAYDELEPHIDARTMEIHHGKHHAGYTTKLNAAISGTDAEGKSIEEILAAPGLSPVVRNNGGGFYNHCLFWTVMSPNGGGMPTGAVAKAINTAFGSFDAFKDAFSNAAATQFGSGWAWLVKNADGSLAVTKTENGVNPLCFGQTALLGCDVWEHSYYIDFRNKRPAYLTNFLDNLVNWENVASRM